MCDMTFWNNEIFHFGIFRIGARWLSVLCDISFQNNGIFHFAIFYFCVSCDNLFQNNGIFHFGIFRFWGVLIFRFTYFSCLSTSKMSQILLLSAVDFVCGPLVLFGFSFLVVIEIGSLARFTCFPNVDLSWIFWSIWNPFFQNTVSSLLIFFLVLYETISNSFPWFRGHLVVGMGKTSQVLFLHTFHVYQPHGEEDWYSLDPVLLVNIAFLLAVKSLV